MAILVAAAPLFGGSGAGFASPAASPPAPPIASTATVVPAAALSAALAREAEAARKSARAIGIHVVDLAGKSEVFGYEADRQRILASNTKLLTTAAVLARLTPEFRFETRFLLRGAIDAAGTLQGDVAILGAGDPNLSGRFHDGDSFAPFRPWARELRARGVRAVAGQLLLVNGIFEEPRVHPDWPRDQLTAWYEAPVEALSFNDNCVLVRVRPGGKGGALARVETVPKVDYFQFRNSARTTSGGGRLVVGRQAAGDTIVVSGTIGERSGPVDVWVAVHDPVAYFAAAMRAMLAEEGVALGAGYQYLHGPPPGVWEQVHVHASGLDQTLAVTNKRSQNFYAESLAKLLGFVTTGHGSWQTATEAVSSFLVELGIAATDFRLADGSGLSRANLATPRAMTTLLERMYFHPFGRDYLLSLPYSGEADLSWKRRLADPPYRGNVFAKTGTLNGVSTLSGYAKASSGRVYAFSILLNETRGASVARGAQDRIVRALVDRG
ncbi:MAG TPA: D-alanyl-D-alanine carboxypeptidase/D-alanyl-D-alanine-endopeptidase [Thermoanaerobaculia bacterium]|nr:D-alanyl-D-alanine carboxypeptidase/D-alanyl-D-alanine-endopeptidase [Thermoanaerobaculia bacterium]